MNILLFALFLARYRQLCFNCTQLRPNDPPCENMKHTITCDNRTQSCATFTKRNGETRKRCYRISFESVCANNAIQGCTVGLCLLFSQPAHDVRKTYMDVETTSLGRRVRAELFSGRNRSIKTCVFYEKSYVK